jgi:hypothetical protein
MCMNRGSEGAELRLGAVRDDASPAWAAFYPEGLPDDWRLPFYAHYWKDLLVLSRDWTRFVSAPGWLDEAPEDLRLYIEVPASEQEVNFAMQALADALGTRLGGFLLERENLAANATLGGRVFARAPFPPMPGALYAAGYAGEAGFVRVVEPRPGLSLRDRRELLEALVRAMPDCRQPLFLHCGPGELEEAETILRLAGLI